MTASDDYRWCVEALLYVVQFQRDPVAKVDHALKHTLMRSSSEETAEQYLRAVRTALAGNESLSTLIPQSHPEETVRAFLRAVEARLVERSG